MNDLQLKTTFAANLLHLRRKKRLSQGALSKSFRVSRTVLQHWENGRAVPNYDLLTTVARHFF